MNERTINDLAVKSGLAEDMGRGYKFPDNYLDFAELIVRECMNICYRTDTEYEGKKVKSTVIASKVAEHFGVEE